MWRGGDVRFARLATKQAISPNLELHAKAA